METIYLKNVSFLQLKQLSRSYSNKTEQVNAELATISGDWLTVYTFAPAGTFTERFKMTAKKFVELEKSTEIKQATFNKHFKTLEAKAGERMAQIEASELKQANDKAERLKAVRVKVEAKKDWLAKYLAERQLTLNDLSRHKVANKLAFKLAHRFDVKQSDLRTIFKTL